jgi:catechol 2,3-dioxygenase-like lactoylglutathione lyase family enzyme
MKAPIGRLHHVGIVVRDLERAEAFVAAARGLPVVNRLSSAEFGVRTIFLACGEATLS